MIAVLGTRVNKLLGNIYLKLTKGAIKIKSTVEVYKRWREERWSGCSSWHRWWICELKNWHLSKYVNGLVLFSLRPKETRIETTTNKAAVQSTLSLKPLYWARLQQITYKSGRMQQVYVGSWKKRSEAFELNSEVVVVIYPCNKILDIEELKTVNLNSVFITIKQRNSQCEQRISLNICSSSGRNYSSVSLNTEGPFSRFHSLFHSFPFCCSNISGSTKISLKK